MTPSANRIVQPEDFGIEVDFTPNTEDPTRVYRAMTGIIQSCEFIDRQFAALFGAGVRSVLLLESIEAGSITTWLRTIIESVDEDALKSGDYKKVIGTYLVKVKGGMNGRFSSHA